MSTPSVANEPIEHSHVRDTTPVTVVLIHRDRPDAIARTCDAFRAQTTPTEVIVVDNGSRPDTVEALPELVGDAELVLTGENLGFGPGGNASWRLFSIRIGDIRPCQRTGSQG